MLVVTFKTEMQNLLATMHQEMQLLISVFMILVLPMQNNCIWLGGCCDTKIPAMQVVVVFYGLLYRTAIAGTCREIEKTKAFVNMLPVQVLSRQVRLFPRCL
jgi:hypothetical protein